MAQMFNIPIFISIIPLIKIVLDFIPYFCYSFIGRPSQKIPCAHKRGIKKPGPADMAGPGLCITFYLWSTELIYWMRSTTLLEYPHSLSYQDTTFTKVSVKAMPALASKMEVRGSLIKSEDTTSSSV